MTQAIRLQGDDNILVATAPLAAGIELENSGVRTSQAIGAGHKVAARPIAAGAPIVKYGQTIGQALCDIDAGAHVHEHNCAMAAVAATHQFGIDLRGAPNADLDFPLEFDGFHRADGRIGTRNFIAVCATVNCSATVVRAIAEAVNRSGILKDFPMVDGVIPLTHATGCGMAGHGDGFDNLERVLWGHATHPNVGAALFVGLGCEVMQIARLAAKYDLSDRSRFHHLTIQASGGTARAIEAGVARVHELLPLANQVSRRTAPASGLSVGLQCGGSDGYSGITANPALGHASDLLVAAGGTAILSETPEIYGAEHLLTRRAATRAIGEKLLARVRWWESYTARSGGEMNNNPSPGNKAGGLTTILEKSLGAVAKAGTLPLSGVFAYGEQIDTPGLVFMDSPGYDPVSVTGQIASGATIICFTTGRGSAFGSKPAPTIKIATNSALFAKMEPDMDINCGAIADGTASVEQMGQKILAQILETASGKPTKSEILGLGDNEFIPWQVGAVM
ncbi:MAG: UxaA family hydrolase [Alphaproteobacteria bacterium]